MLMLTRCINEIVMVGDDIEVKVLGVYGNRVLLGFKAPKNIAVHRKEIYQLIKNKSLLNHKTYRK